MAGYLVAVGLSAGDDLVGLLGRLGPWPETAPAAGALLHLAIAAVYGALFGVTARFLGRRGLLLPVWLVGYLYAAALLMATRLALLPGADALLREIGPVHLALAHLLYGVTLGLLFAW